MKIGTIIRKSYELFMTNPIIVFPFLFLGIIRNISLQVSENVLVDSISALGVTLNSFLLNASWAANNLRPFFFNFVILLLIFAFMLVLLSSFVEAYAIGLSIRMVRSKTTDLKEGFSTFNNGLQIFFKKLIIIALVLGGSIILFLPTWLLFGRFGVFISFFLLIAYLTLLLVAAFFADQSIVLNKVGAWEGLVKSYNFIRRNTEGGLIIILFVFFLSFGISMVQGSIELIGRNFFSGLSSVLFTKGINLLLFYVILLPYIVILKTHYYMRTK